MAMLCCSLYGRFALYGVEYIDVTRPPPGVDRLVWLQTEYFSPFSTCLVSDIDPFGDIIFAPSA